MTGQEAKLLVGWPVKFQCTRGFNRGCQKAILAELDGDRARVQTFGHGPNGKAIWVSVQNVHVWIGGMNEYAKRNRKPLPEIS